MKTITDRLAAALRSTIDYAESEAHTIRACLTEQDDEAEADAADEACSVAREALASYDAAEEVHGVGAIDREAQNAIHAGLRLLQHFNDGTCVITHGERGARMNSRMEDIAAIRDESGEMLTNSAIDMLCEGLAEYELFFN